MSFGFGMGAGLRALNAAQLGMRTAGNNVANANTPGYSRQRIELSSSLSFGAPGSLQLGTGVDVRGISRLIDEGLERRLQFQLGLVGGAELDELRFREIESIFGEPDQGLSTNFQDLFGALDQLRTDPADRALRGGLIQAGNSISQQFQLVSQRLGDLSESTFSEVNGLVRTVNQRTKAIAELNGQIITAEANGSDANDLRDTRSQHITELSKMLDTRAIERSSGSIDLLVGGNLVVAGNRTTTMRVDRNNKGHTQVMVGSNKSAAPIREGRIAALLRQEQDGLPGFTSRIDDLARSTILEWNRLHSTGMPASGPFQSLTAAYGAVDGDGDGQAGDELLSQAGFAFPIENGSLYVSVTDETTGDMKRTRIDIDPNSMSLDDFAAEVSNIEHISATVDPTGRLRINSDSGYGFDFSPRLDPNPDGGTFGGLNPTVGSQAAGPYNLSAQTFPVNIDVTTGTAASPVVTTVTLDASDFQQSSAATAEELAAAINNDLGAAGTASSVGGRLMMQSSQGGVTSQLSLANSGGGTVLDDLSMSTATAAGRDIPVGVSVEGAYTGTDNNQFTFVPESDGIIGQTDDLRVRVFDKDGGLVTTLSVGSGYEPREQIELGNGIRVAFSAGEISATDGQAFALDALSDSDTSDILVATGMNAFFLGSSASDIKVNQALLDNPDSLSAGIGSASGDAGNLARLVGLRDRNLGDLSSNTIEDFYADLVGDIGFETAAARSTLQAQDQLLAQLQNDRESISGVNIDEEMVDMLKYQQSYEAAARFIKVAQEMTSVLINLGR
ncbi:MAG: flagellar hook-associated protein FlgK [Planctomycetota bacterium]|jgi:flagellar hook-associated protein FlgK